MKLDINDLNVQEAVKAAVLAQITEEARERLIAGALEYLLKEEKSTYSAGTRPSPLQSAVNGAVDQLAREIVEAEIKNRPEFREAIRKQLGLAVERVIADDWDVSESIARALTEALRNR